MKLYIGAISDVGCVRAQNEDMILVGSELLRDSARQYDLALPGDAKTLVAVADGLGGHKGGAVASERVLIEMSQAIRRIAGKMQAAELKLAIKETVTAVHSIVNREGLADPEKAGMGSTFAGLLIYEDSIYTINIGDSRIYRFRGGMLSQLSRDHSLSAMTNDPDAPKNVLVNSFGAGSKIFFDFENITNRVIPDDVLLLCSDGLTNELSETEMEAILSESIDPALLVEAAKQKGGRDNISIVTVKYENVTM
jgi:PPM family protein phosphatase